MWTMMQNDLLGKKLLSSFYLYRFHKHVSYDFSIINFCNPGVHYEMPCICIDTRGMTHNKRRRHTYSRHKIGTYCRVQYEHICEMWGSDISYNEVFQKIVASMNNNILLGIEHMEFVNRFLTRVSQNTTFRWMLRRWTGSLLRGTTMSGMPLRVPNGCLLKDWSVTEQYNINSTNTVFITQ